MENLPQGNADSGKARYQAGKAVGVGELAAFDRRLRAACERAAEVTRERLRRVSLADLAGA